MNKGTHFIGQPTQAGPTVAQTASNHRPNNDFPVLQPPFQGCGTASQDGEEERRNQGACQHTCKRGRAFGQPKQNFPLGYFYGESANAIKIQIWVTLIANLLPMVMQKRIKRNWSFSCLATMFRIMLMYYANCYTFFEWRHHLP